jgi:hypothetical protein
MKKCSVFLCNCTYNQEAMAFLAGQTDRCARAHTCILYIFFLQWLFQAIQGPGLLFSSSQGLYLNRGQHKHRTNTYTPNMHALSGSRTQDPSIRANEDSSYLGHRGYGDQLFIYISYKNKHYHYYWAKLSAHYTDSLSQTLLRYPKTALSLESTS